MKLYSHPVYLTLLAVLIISCNSNTKQNDYNKIAQISTKYIDGYVGDASCISCHENEYDLWKGSHHDLAMQVASDSTVLGNFNNVKALIDGVSYFFFKENNEFLVKVKEIDNSEKKYKIAYTFGFTPLQQYLIDFDNGQKQVLRVTWDSVKNKWFHQYKGEAIQPHDWLHWSNGAQNWNTMCAECHSTNLKKNYFVEKDSFHTTYSSINVSCESCHGPAERHLNWANSKSKSKNTYILKGKAQNEQMNLCAPCHARRVKLTKNLEPGKQFENQYMVQNLTVNYYHGDGQIREEDYVYGSFLQSKMYDEGVKCSDCHDAHSMQLKFKGNKLCLQCHVPADYDNKKHHFHKENTEASQCINCHMTGNTYMGNDFRRDHSFRIPRPDQSVKYNTPNACKECHDDKTNQWAANTIKKWYGNQRQEHFSDALLLSTNQNLSLTDRESLDTFINNLQFPEIARATVIENLDYSTNNQLTALLLALNDSSAIVRYNALLKFRNATPQDRVAIALKHMNDSIKLVRIGAAQLTIGFDDNTLIEVDKNNFIKSRGELEVMLYSNADFSTGRMQLGDYYLQNNDIKTAIKHYEIALQKDSLLIPVYSNLATAYSLNKEYIKANETLDTWILLEPKSNRPHYLKALLNFEMNNNEIAIAELNTALKLDPNDTRSLYNLAT
ncbi:MAG: hypothetical protein KAT78_05385, partial [Flavobacteriaceae bacterium]|nr:hypothetical protein [Flavobacteriaceae bacterium]